MYITHVYRSANLKRWTNFNFKNFDMAKTMEVRVTAGYKLPVSEASPVKNIQCIKRRILSSLLNLV